MEELWNLERDKYQLCRYSHVIPKWVVIHYGRGVLISQRLSESVTDMLFFGLKYNHNHKTEILSNC